MVVIARGNGVELVIVTPAALKRRCQENLPHGIRHIIQIMLSGDLRHLHGRQFPRPHAKEAGCDQQFRVFGINLVAGQLLASELVEWFVVIERADDVITISPGIASIVVICETSGIGVPRSNVKPVIAPLFAIVWAGQEPFNNFCKGDGIVVRVVNKSLDLLRRGRQAQQIECGPANQRATIGKRRARAARSLRAFD